ncbi:glycosyltransferase [Blastococcus saxobsidens]|uniref:Putative glycosyltransferase n=1 Tax=Blastococcus saxobsidens (strain DD2) TaxID=1146883 RepID=H6RMX9_BLASD|nr:glycosyltransferase [Blastococcus saxobsidens]CCG01332.1 putative glycosyltransferase [Blastococcus saxobsidens DD2]
MITSAHVGPPKLRVLHVLTSTQRRGAESFALSVQRGLRERGHDTRPVALVGASHPPTLPVDPLGATHLGPATLMGLRRAAADVDVVVAHGSRTLPACALALCFSRVPVVYVNIGDPLFWANTPLRRARVRLMFRRLAAVAARTEASRKALIDHLGMRPAAVRVIGNGRRSSDFPPTDEHRRAAARKALGLDGAGDVVVHAGALAPEKRVDVLIDAVGRMDSSTRLVLAGDGLLRAELERQARAVLGDRAVFLGVRNDVAQVLAAADVLALASDSEGLPGVVIEAGLVGIPVVATAVGFTSSVVVDGVTGVLVEPGDPVRMARAVETALTAAEEMGAAGRRHCMEQFEMERILDAWESLLHEVAR